MPGTKAGTALRTHGIRIGVHGVTCLGGSLNACAIAGLTSARGKIPPVTAAKAIATGNAADFDRTVRELLRMIILQSEGWSKIKSKHRRSRGLETFELPNRSKCIETAKELKYAEMRIDTADFGSG